MSELFQAAGSDPDERGSRRQRAGESSASAPSSGPLCSYPASIAAELRELRQGVFTGLRNLLTPGEVFARLDERLGAVCGAAPSRFAHLRQGRVSLRPDEVARINAALDTLAREELLLAPARKILGDLKELLAPPAEHVREQQREERRLTRLVAPRLPEEEVPLQQEPATPNQEEEVDLGSVAFCRPEINHGADNLTSHLTLQGLTVTVPATQVASLAVDMAGVWLTLSAPAKVGR